MDDTEITRLQPGYLTIMRIRALAFAVSLVIVGVAGEVVNDWIPLGTLLGPLTLIAFAWAWVIPKRRFRRKGFAMGEDRLRVVSGFLFHSDIVVPFGRVQHLDVLQGPLERMFSLATLVLHTAGTQNSSVSLPGLKHEDAVAMRETIRAHIKREMS